MTEGPRALPVVLAAVAAGVVLMSAVLVPYFVVGDEGVSRSAAAESEEPSLADVRVFEALPNAHTDDGVDYEQSPPIGGAHDPEWLDCGPYDAPVRDENAVHDLEHGTVWITYEPGLPDADVSLLEDILPRNGLLSPYVDLPAPVVVTVWGRQLRLDGANDPRLALFIGEYGDGRTAPEPFASCAGGLRESPDTGTSV